MSDGATAAPSAAPGPGLGSAPPAATEPAAPPAQDPGLLQRDWQLRAAARAPPSDAAWWRRALESQYVAAAVAALVALLVLAVVSPPLVQRTAETPLEPATLSLPKALVWAAVVGIVVAFGPALVSFLAARCA